MFFKIKIGKNKKDANQSKNKGDTLEGKMPDWV